MPTRLRVLGACLIVGVMISVPCWYKARQERRYRNVHVVRPGVLWRSGQPDIEGLQHFVRRFDIKTIVCLRDADSELSRNEEAWARSRGIQFVRIPPRAWGHVNGVIPAEKGLDTFRDVMSRPENHPVLVHCFKGVHRTGAYCAIYRMDCQGWTNREALAEMRLMGYETLEEDRDILGYLTTYARRTTGIIYEQRGDAPPIKYVGRVHGGIGP